jgi:hypothetical protein
MSTFSKIAQGLRLTGVTGATNDMVGNWLKELGLAGATPDMLFTYLRSTGLTGSLSDMLSAYVFSSVQDKVLVDLSPTSGGFYSLSNDWVTTADYSIKCNIYISDVSGISVAAMIFGDSNSGNNCIFVRPDGSIEIRDTSGTSRSSGSVITSAKLHTIEYIVLSGNITGYLNGVKFLSSISFGNISFNSIGVRQTNQFFFEGIIADVGLTDTTTPANSLEFKLNELTANTETNNGVTLTYNNIGTGTSVRNTYVLSNGGTQYISDLRTIDIAAQA